MAPEFNSCKKKDAHWTVDSPYRCYKHLGYGTSSNTDCEALCDTFAWCIGYYLTCMGDLRGRCYLLTGEKETCPSGFTHEGLVAILPEDELVGYPGEAYCGCYARGKTK